MSLFGLKKNDRVKVKVIDKRQFSNKAIYEVEYQGRKCQVPMFEFQKKLPLPQEIECVVQIVNDNSLYLQQNIAALIRQNYSVGKIYEFTVEQDYTNTSSPHYKLTDGSGFYFKLSSQKDLRFTKNRKIRCRINCIHGVDVDLEYVGIVHEMNDSFRLNVLVERIGSDVLRLLAFFRHNPGFDEIKQLYDDGMPEWLPQAIEFCIADFSNVTPEEVTPLRREMLDALSRCVVWFLEDSDYFDKFPENDRYEWQDRFRRALRHIEALRSAYRLIADGEGRAFTDRIVRKFKASGYLIDADHKLLTLKYLLSIEPAGLVEVVDDMLTVVTDRRADIMREPTFRRAFIDLFQLYVDNNCGMLDEMDEAETTEARNALQTMVRLLAIQLLLADVGNSDIDYGIDFEINRSRLYRYLTLQNNSGDEELLDKALNALLASENWRTEYTWKDVDEIIKLSTRLRQPAEVATLPAVYETPDATLSVNESAIDIDESGAAEVRVFPPDDTLPELWHSMSVNLTSQLPANLRSPRTIPQYKRFWAEIERRFAEGNKADQSAARLSLVPSRGQDVEIEITGPDPSNRDRFLCRVVEEGWRGEGWIDRRDITTGSQDLPYSVFTDDAGRPLVFAATVKGGHDDQSLEFSMTDTLNDYFNSIISYDDIEDCAILKKIGDSCTVLSRRGFTLNVELDSDHDYLETGDVIRVSNIIVNGNWREGEFLYESGGHLDFQSITRNMLREFALKELPDDDPGDDPTADEMAATQEANRISASGVGELIRIIESVASKVRENRTAYNYYSYARLLARLIEDAGLTEYFDKRCQLLEEFDDFSTNGRVDLTHLDSLMADLMKENNSLSTDGEKLRILSVLDHPENNGMLWNLFCSGANESLQELARLVMAYNMLDGFKMADERQAVRHKIYSKLKVDIEKEPTRIADGREGLTTEFKTSIAYPANSMRLDVVAQTNVILKVITSFLNTEGGTLYIGVSDEGYVRGLEADLKHFRSRDSFDRHVHDNIRKHLTYIPNLHHYIETCWSENSGKEIYEVRVKPYVEPVALDGVYYQREGSSCVMVRSENEAAFIAARSLSGAPRQEAAESARVAPAATARPATVQPARAVTAPSEEVAVTTNRFRNNVLHDGYDGYEDVTDYLYIFGDGSFEISEDDRWQEDSCSLALGIHPSERQGNLVIVSADGYALRTPVGQLADSDRRFSSKLRPVYISPIGDDDKLIMIYRDGDGTTYKRLFPASSIKCVKSSDRGELLLKEIEDVLFCELVTPDCQSSFKALVRKQRIGKDDASVERERAAILERLGKQ